MLPLEKMIKAVIIYHHLTLHCLLRPSSTLWQRLAMFGAVLANLLNKLADGTGIFTTSFTTKAA